MKINELVRPISPCIENIKGDKFTIEEFKNLIYNESIHTSLDKYQENYHLHCVYTASSSLGIIARNMGFAKNFHDNIDTFINKINNTADLCTKTKNYLYKHMHLHLKFLLALKSATQPQEIKDLIGEMLACIGTDVEKALGAIASAYKQCAQNNPDEVKKLINRDIFDATAKLLKKELMAYLNGYGKLSKNDRHIIESTLDEYYFHLQDTELKNYFTSPQYHYFNDKIYRNEMPLIIQQFEKNVTLPAVFKQLVDDMIDDNEKSDSLPTVLFNSLIQAYPNNYQSRAYSSPLENVFSENKNTNKNFLAAALTQFLAEKSYCEGQIKIKTIGTKEDFIINSFDEIIWIESKTGDIHVPVSLLTFTEYNILDKIPCKTLSAAIKNTPSDKIESCFNSIWVTDPNKVFHEIEDKNIFRAKKIFQKTPYAIENYEFDFWEARINSAIEQGDDDIAEDLLQVGSISKESICYITLKTIRFGHNKTLRKMLNLAYAHGISTINNYTFLMYAAMEQKPDALYEILKHKITDKNAQCPKGNTALMLAISKKLTENVRILINHSVDVNLKDEHGHTALVLAVSEKNKDVVKLLMAYEKTDISLVANNGETALSWAITLNSLDIIKCILDKCDINKLYCKDLATLTALNHHNCNEETALYIFEKASPPDINAKDRNGDTLLHKSIDKTFDYVALLIARDDINVNIQNNMGHTVLMNICRSKHCRYKYLHTKQQIIEILDLILSKNVLNVNIQDNNGKTALHYSVEFLNHADGEIFNAINEKLFKIPGIDWHLKDKEGYSIVDLLKEENDSRLNKLYAKFAQ